MRPLSRTRYCEGDTWYDACRDLSLIETFSASAYALFGGSTTAELGEKIGHRESGCLRSKFTAAPMCSEGGGVFSFSFFLGGVGGGGGGGPAHNLHSCGEASRLPREEPALSFRSSSNSRFQPRGCRAFGSSVAMRQRRGIKGLGHPHSHKSTTATPESVGRREVTSSIGAELQRPDSRLDPVRQA